jgi:uncharacterized DUF497 family protein
MIFSWDDWNVEHIGEHGVTRDEAEFVVRHAAPPFPAESADGKSVVWGKSRDGRYLQVIFVHRSEEEIDYESLTLGDLLSLEDNGGPVIYVVHAMDLTAKMKRQYRKRRS